MLAYNIETNTTEYLFNGRNDSDPTYSLDETAWPGARYSLRIIGDLLLKFKQDCRLQLASWH